MKKLSDVNYKPYIYILPVILFTLFIKLYPVLSTFFYSFTNWYGGADFEFVGLQNYLRYFQSPIFWKILSHNVWIIIVAIPLDVFIGLILATLLYEKVRGWRYYQTVFFIPTILSTVVAGIVWSYFFQLDGLINIVLRLFGLGGNVEWLANPQYALWALIIVVIWRDFGFATVLFLAELMSVSPSLFDAAKVDGATWFQTLWYVTLPRLKGVIEFFVVITTWAYFNYIFNYVYVMTGGGPGYSTTVLEYYIYEEGFRYGYLGSATALSVILFGATLTFGFLQIRLMGQEQE